MQRLLLVLLSLLLATPTDAQTRADFTGVTPGHTVTVVGDDRQKTTGRVRFVTPDRLTMVGERGDIDVDRDKVASVYERKNGVKKGMLIGLLGAVGIVVAGCITASCDDDYSQMGMVVFPLMGVAAGAAIDAMIPERRFLYRRVEGFKDFHALTPGMAVTLATHSTNEMQGRVLAVSADELTVDAAGSVRTFPRGEVDAIFENGDSIKNGALSGLLAGAVGGFTAGAAKDDCDHTPVENGIRYHPLFDCSADEKIVHGLVIGALAGTAGAVIGGVIDKAIDGRRLVYRPSNGRQIAVTIRPAVSPRFVALTGSASW